MSEAKPNFGGFTNVTSPNQSLVDLTSKKPADDRSKMLSFATVPSQIKQNSPYQIKQNSPQAPNKTSTNIGKDETRGKSNPKDANKATSRQKGAVEKNTTSNEAVPDIAHTFEEIISEIFMLQKIFKNHPVTEPELQLWTGVFRMTEDYETRQASTQLLKTQNLKAQILEYLSSMQPQNKKPNVNPIFDDFTTVSLGLIEKIPYLSNLACAFFLNKYVDLNLDKIYEDKLKMQDLRQKGKDLENSKTYYKIINCISELVMATFRQYQAILKYFAYLVSNNQVKKCSFLQKLIKTSKILETIIDNIWHSFSNIVLNQINQPGRQYALFDEINLMTNCLNYCFQIHPEFFSREFTIKKVFPLLQRAIRVLERSQWMEMKLIDKLVLNLVLVHPFGIANFNSDSQLNRFLSTSEVGQRYSYLFLFRKQVDVEDLQPLKDIQTAVFLQNYLTLNKNIQDYDEAKNRFIFSSICEMFKEKYNELEENKKKYKHIRKYIEFYVENIWENSEEDNRDEEEDQFQSEKEREREFVPESYLNVCRLAKLINSLCAVSFTGGILEQTFNLVTGQNRRNSNRFLEICFDLIGIANNDEKGEFSKIENYLSEHSLSCEVVYEFFYKFIIQDATYLERGEAMVTQKGFESVGQFYEVIITSYVLNYANRANIYSLNLLAYSSLVKNEMYVKVCRNIADTISSLKNYDVAAYDQENNQIIKNHLQFIVQKILQIKGDQENNLQAFSQLILNMFDFNTFLLETPWVKAMITRMKKITISYHPIVLQKYTEVLLRILKHFNQLEDYKLELESYFEFKHINDFLHYVLTFQAHAEGRQIRNKYMSCRNYQPVAIAVDLIKNMSSLYLRQAENRLGRVPFEVKRMMEKENRGSDYQLVFTKEATSYASAIAVILLSQELEKDFRISKKFPNLHEDLFECLINLQRVANLLKYEMNFRVCNLYNLRSEIEINEKIQVENTLLQKIKHNPTYLGFEYYMNSTEGRTGENGYILSKLTASNSNIKNLETQARLVLISWKAIIQGRLKMSIAEGWKNITKLLDKITKGCKQIQLDQNRKSINTALGYLFEFSISLKKKNIELYGKFVLEYHHFFIDYKINNYEMQQKSAIFDEAMTYFFGIKSLLPSHLFQQFAKSETYQISLFEYITGCLDATQEHAVRKNVREDILLMVELALSCVIDVCVSGPNVKKCMETVFQKLRKRVEEKDSIYIREIIILNLVCGILQTQLNPQKLYLKGDYWQLMANCLRADVSVGELLLLEFQNVFIKHEIYFVSFCNFFRRLAQNEQLQYLLDYQHIRLQRTFLEIIEILLIKSIQEHKSYYVIWLIEILSQMASNRAISPYHQQNLYFRLNQLFFDNKTVSSRVNEMLGLLAYKYALECPLTKDAKQNGSEKFTLGMKQELVAYLRIMTIIYFCQNKEVFQEHLNNQEDIRINQTIQNQQIDFQLLAYDLVPLLTKLISSNDGLIDDKTVVERKLSLIKVDQLRASKLQKSGVRKVSIDQAHRVWDEKYTVLTLLDQLLNYELVSIFSVWVSLVLNFGEGKPTLHASIYKDPHFDAKANQLVQFLQAVIQKLSELRRNASIIDEVLKQFDISIYQSMAVSKEMLFTSCGSLGSHLEISYEQVSSKLSEVVFVVYKMLDNIFSEKKALKSSSVLNFRKIMKNLKSVEEMIQQVDPHFAVELKPNSYRADSEQLSRNYTVRNR